MRPSAWTPALAAGAVAVGALASPVPASAQPPSACVVADPCTAPRRAGEVSIVWLGDSGYGEGGASEWGGHAQAAVAKRMDALCPRPDLVFFLGDNIYWGGSPDLFGPRFDTMYRNLFDLRGHRVHAALGNHDVKGCRVAADPAFPPGQTCLDALERAVREGVEREVAAGTSPDPATAAEAGETAVQWLADGLRERALAVPMLDCPSAFDAGYEQSPDTTKACYASAALRHAEFGFHRRGETPLRYYTVDWPLSPPAEAAGAVPPAGEAAAVTDPHVRVLVADSNTLDVRGSFLLPAPPAHDPGAPPVPRTDRLQLLWLENQLRTAPAGAWTFTVMHHPPFTPRGCVFRFLGQCVGGHVDEASLHAQLKSTWGAGEDGRSNGPHAPDFVMTSHNHFYARTRALDGLGYPAAGTARGVRYFVTGGGGAPLYRQGPLHTRYAAGGSFHHFVYMRLQRETAFFWTVDPRGHVHDSGCLRRGENQDRCIARGTYTSADVVCGEPPPGPGGCAPAAP